MWITKLVASAREELKRLSKARKQEAAEIIRDLAEDPFPPDSNALRGFRDYYRFRSGDAATESSIACSNRAESYSLPAFENERMYTRVYDAGGGGGGGGVEAL